MSAHFFNSPKIRLRTVGFAEGLSFLILVLIGVPLKRFGGEPIVVQLVGPIHGLLFVLYIFAVIQAWTAYNWSFGKTALALLASVIPGGTFYADHKLFRHLPGNSD